MKKDTIDGYSKLVKLCKDAGCPKVYLNNTATESKKIAIEDDFGNIVFMSKSQFEQIQPQFKKIVSNF